jgi:hypothetical protein
MCSVGRPKRARLVVTLSVQSTPETAAAVRLIAKTCRLSQGQVIDAMVDHARKCKEFTINK